MYFIRNKETLIRICQFFWSSLGSTVGVNFLSMPLPKYDSKLMIRGRDLFMYLRRRRNGMCMCVCDAAHNILWYLSGFPAGNDRREIYIVSGHDTCVSLSKTTTYSVYMRHFRAKRKGGGWGEKPPETYTTTT